MRDYKEDKERLEYALKELGEQLCAVRGKNQDHDDEISRLVINIVYVLNGGEWE